LSGGAAGKKLPCIIQYSSNSTLSEKKISAFFHTIIIGPKVAANRENTLLSTFHPGISKKIVFLCK
jgi:hypothetical protein